jgi:hypothetical protein
MCDVEVDEDDEKVTVSGFVCTGYGDEPVDRSDSCDCPVHVYLRQPLGGRKVIDGHSGQQVPYRNVYANLDAVWNGRG